MDAKSEAFREQAGKGRPKGAQNKTTKLAKQAIAEAFEKLGGTEALVAWAKDSDDNKRVFYSTIWPKIIPVQTELTGKDGEAIQIEQRTREDAEFVSRSVLGLAERARAAAMANDTQH